MGPKVSEEDETVVSSAAACTGYASVSYMMTSDEVQNLDVQSRKTAPRHSLRSQDAPPGVCWHVCMKAWTVNSSKVDNGRKRKAAKYFHVKHYLDSNNNHEKADSLARQAAIEYRDKEISWKKEDAKGL